MLFLYIGLYLFILALLWGFFIVAKLHSYKFKNFSSNIEKVTVVLFVFLLFLSISGFVLLFFIDAPKTTVQIEDFSTFEENYY